MKTLFDVLQSLDDDTILSDGNGTITAGELLDSGDSDLVEPATLEGSEIFLTTESGDVYTAADPAYTIVR